MANTPTRLVLKYRNIAGGINRDFDQRDLDQGQPLMWYDGVGIRHDNNIIETTRGYTSLTATSVTPHSTGYWSAPNQKYHIYSDGPVVRRWSPAGDTNISRATAYADQRTTTALADGARWYFGQLHGGVLFIANNKDEQPQRMFHSDTRLANFTDWNYGTAYRWVKANHVGVWRNQVIAAGLTFNSSAGVITEAPGTIRISSIVTPGNEPVWQPLSTAAGDTSTNDADEFETGLKNIVITSRELKQNIFLWTENEIAGITTVGTNAAGGLAYSTDVISQVRGTLNPNTVVEVYGKIISWDHYGPYMFNGSADSINDIGAGFIKDTVLSEINPLATTAPFFVPDYENQRVEFHYPTGTNTSCDKVVVYDFTTGLWDFDTSRSATSGVLGVVTGDGTTDRPGSTTVYNNLRRYIVVGDTANDMLLVKNTGFDNDVDHYIERIFDFDEHRGVDGFSVKSLHNILFWFSSKHPNTNIRVRMKMVNNPTEVVDWDNDNTIFDEMVNTGNRKISLDREGLALAIRFDAIDAHFGITGIDFQITPRRGGETF